MGAIEEETREMALVYETAPVVGKELGYSPEGSHTDSDSDGVVRGEVEVASVRVSDAWTEVLGGVGPELVFREAAELLVITVPDGATELAGEFG